MASTLEAILASRKSLYDPQRALVQKQMEAMPAQQAADVAGLETAKTNAFGDITNQANDRGMVYSGAPIQEQQRYVGERYLPALAGVKNNYADRLSKLEAALLGINQDETTTAQQMQAAQQKAEYDYALEQQKMAQQAALERRNSLDMVSMFAPQKAAQQVDPVAAARGLAKTRLQEARTNGVNQPFYRERVLQELLGMGIDNKTANQIVYKEVFPDSWAGSTASPSQQKSMMASLGYGGSF